MFIVAGVFCGSEKKHCQRSGARLRGRKATQRSKKGSEKVLGMGSGKGFSDGL